MLQFFLIAFYTLVFCAIMHKSRFFKNAKIPFWAVSLIFILKIGIGIFYGYLHQVLYNGADTATYFSASQKIYNTFYNNPLHFFELTLLPNNRPAPHYLRYLTDPLPSWTDSRTYLMFRINAYIHFFSFGYYNIHVIFFNFFAMCGLTALYRSFTTFFAENKKIIGGIIFFTPSVLFWGSGVHKEPISFLCIGITIWFLITYFKNKKINYLNLCLVIFLNLILAIMRPYLWALLMPAIFSYIFCRFSPTKTFIKYVCIYILGVLSICILPLINSKLDFFNYITYIQKQYVLFQQGYSDIPLPLMQPNLMGIIHNTPIAFFNVLCMPNFTTCTYFFDCLAAFETLILNLFLLIWACLFFKNRSQLQHKNIVYLYLFYSISVLLIIGLTVDNVGAIVRYRSVVMPLLLCALAAGIPHNYLKINFLYNLKNKINK